jgi:hypothetical protein
MPDAPLPELTDAELMPVPPEPLPELAKALADETS